MNETFTVASMMDCDTILNCKSCDFEDYLWRETHMGCKILLLLQEIHKFNITYIGNSESELAYHERMGTIYEFDELIDIYAKPRSLWKGSLYNASPILPVFSWRFGYTIRRMDHLTHRFYSQPFTSFVWHCLLAMMLLGSSLFYVLSRAERRLLGGNVECHWSQELLVTIGAYCQHYLPVEPMELTSRRIAFFSFFLFSFVIYSYYTSTLLRHLVHDRDGGMNLDMLVSSTVGNVVLDQVALITKVLVDQLNSSFNNMSSELQVFVQKQFSDIRVVNLSTGLEEVLTGQTALLSDYSSLYKTMRHTYDKEVLCDLVEVDLFSNVIKYFFTSKNFKYTEEFKISSLWVKETGVLRRLLQQEKSASWWLSQLDCQGPNFQAQFRHIQMPVVVLACSYVLCVITLFGEKIYYNKTKVWPYVE